MTTYRNGADAAKQLHGKFLTAENASKSLVGTQYVHIEQFHLAPNNSQYTRQQMLDRVIEKHADDLYSADGNNAVKTEYGQSQFGSHDEFIYCVFGNMCRSKQNMEIFARQYDNARVPNNSRTGMKRISLAFTVDDDDWDDFYDGQKEKPIDLRQKGICLDTVHGQLKEYKSNVICATFDINPALDLGIVPITAYAEIRPSKVNRIDSGTISPTNANLFKTLIDDNEFISLKGQHKRGILQQNGNRSDAQKVFYILASKNNGNFDLRFTRGDSQSRNPNDSEYDQLHAFEIECRNDLILNLKYEDDIAAYPKYYACAGYKTPNGKIVPQNLFKNEIQTTGYSRTSLPTNDFANIDDIDQRMYSYLNHGIDRFKHDIDRAQALINELNAGPRTYNYAKVKERAAEISF